MALHVTIKKIRTMKRISYYLVLFLILVIGNSCEEEDYKSMNITQYQEGIDIKQFVGDLTSHIVVKNSAGEDVTDVDMGAVFFVIDNTEGGADSRTWTVTQNGETKTYTKQLERFVFTKPGDAVISLESKRASDGATITSSVTIPINWIPVDAEFTTVQEPVDGVITIFQGASIDFITTLAGSPTMFDWQIVGTETITSDEQNPTIRFVEPGTYNVTFTASRDDGATGITEKVVQKTGLIVVKKLNIEIIRAVATDGKIVVEYNHPINQVLPAEVASEFSVTINTAAGAVLTPEIQSISAIDDYKIEIVFADKMYSDDVVILNFTSAGHFVDKTGLGEILNDEEPCVYGHNLMINTDMEDPSRWGWNWNPDPAADYGFVNENSEKYAIKPYQGLNCLYMVQGGGVSIGLEQGLTFAAGDVFEIAYEAQKLGNTGGGGFERRASLIQWSGGNDAGGNWSSANDPGLNFWKTLKQKVVVGDAAGSGGTKGKVGTFYFTLIRYNGSATEPIFIDNFRIYIPNPRP